MTADIETLVIGGGVVGLAIARALALAGHEVMLIERHDRLGTETSARNSEVVHAGLYYPTGSMRARLCVAGKELLYRFCDENGVAAKRCGKLLVATTEAELPKLHAIAEQAARNGVNDLVALSGEAARELEPAVSCIAAYLSPSTGVIDAAGLVAALDGHVTSLGGSVVLSTTATSLDRTADGLWRIGIESGGETASLTAKRVVNAAGHGATTLAIRSPLPITARRARIQRKATISRSAAGRRSTG